MRRYLTVLAVVLLTAVVVTACGKDRPTSVQSLIFGTWNAQSAVFTFKRVTFTEGSSPLVGTYVATVLSQGDPNGPVSENEEQGTIGIVGTSLLITRPSFGQATWPFSVDGNLLTLTTNVGAELYAK